MSASQLLSATNNLDTGVAKGTLLATGVSGAIPANATATAVAVPNLPLTASNTIVIANLGITTANATAGQPFVLANATTAFVNSTSFNITLPAGTNIASATYTWFVFA